MKYVLEVEELRYKYPVGKDYVLKGVSLRVERGEFLGILGPTGAGKTTLCMCLNGLIPHYKGGELHGSIRIMNKDSLTESVAGLANHVGVVFQDPESQLITSSVEDEIAFGLLNRGFDQVKVQEIVNETLETLGIAHLRKRVPQTCSGGEKQKIAIAATIALQPQIVVFDEATSDLDAEGIGDVFRLAERLNREGKTIIFVTHEVEHLVEHATRVVLLADGKIRLDGTPETILSEWHELLKLGVRMPQVSQFAVELKDRGLPISTIPRTIKQAEEQLITLCKGG